MKDNGFKLVKERRRRYPAQTIIDVDYADDIALLVNTPAQAETLLYSLERAAAGIGLHVNVGKTECMCFNQICDISTLNGCSLKKKGEVHLPWMQCPINRERHQQQLHKNAASSGGSTRQSSSCTATYLSSQKLSKLDMRDNAGGVRTNS